MDRLLSSKALPMLAFLAFIVVLLPLVVFLVKHGQSAYGSGTQPATHTLRYSSTPGSNPTPNFGAFVGRWVGHGRVLIFSSNGRAKYIARAYQWCGPGVSPPCDSFQNNNIINGIHEEMLFNSVAGKTAYGTITASNAGKSGRVVSLALDAHDTVTLTNGENPADILLCGSNAPVAACGA